jgi:hypothetical protein
MAVPDTQFSGSIAEIDEPLLVPLIFQHYADDVARRVATTKPQELLETAAGTGVVTRTLAGFFPTHGSSPPISTRRCSRKPAR